MKGSMAHAHIQTPIGTVTVTGDGRQLIQIAVGEEPADANAAPDALLREALAQIDAWFAGTLTTFDLPLAPAITPRGPDHRAAIAGIGYGETASYGALARMIGSSPRAIGQACRRNPFPIIIPCHRVLGAGGALGHYSAGQGIATKNWLLHHERKRMI